MNGSKLPLLSKINTIVLSAGHGGTDPGAVSGSTIERDNTIYIINKIKALLQGKGLNVASVPDSLDGGVTWVNAKYKSVYSAWAIEIHRDSFPTIKEPSASLRCGCYYGTSNNSKVIADFLKDKMKEYGAHATSWSRSDTKSQAGSLGWIRKTYPLAHLIELGFVQGKSTKDHLDKLALIATKAIYEAFTGKKYEVVAPVVVVNTPITPIETKPPVETTPEDTSHGFTNLETMNIYQKIEKYCLTIPLSWIKIKKDSYTYKGFANTFWSAIYTGGVFLLNFISERTTNLKLDPYILILIGQALSIITKQIRKFIENIPKEDGDK